MKNSEKYLSDVDSDDLVRKVSSKIDLEIQNADLFSYGSNDGENQDGIYGALANGAIMILGGAVGIGIKEGIKAGYHAITHEKKRQELLKTVMDYRNQDMSPYLDSVFSKKDQLISIIKKAFITDLVVPIQSQVEEILANTKEREEQKNEAKQSVSTLSNELEIISKQIAEIS